MPLLPNFGALCLGDVGPYLLWTLFCCGRWGGAPNSTSILPQNRSIYYGTGSQIDYTFVFLSISRLTLFIYFLDIISSFFWRFFCNYDNTGLVLVTRPNKNTMKRPIAHHKGPSSHYESKRAPLSPSLANDGWGRWFLIDVPFISPNSLTLAILMAALYNITPMATAHPC